MSLLVSVAVLAIGTGQETGSSVMGCMGDGGHWRGQSIGGESIGVGRTILAGVITPWVSPPPPMYPQRWPGAACPRVAALARAGGARSGPVPSHPSTLSLHV